VNSRTTVLPHPIGNWEGDLITGRMKKSAIDTLVNCSCPPTTVPRRSATTLAAELATIPEVAHPDLGSGMALHEQRAPLSRDDTAYPSLAPARPPLSLPLRQYEDVPVRKHATAS
jgi:hypothetical protein